MIQNKVVAHYDNGKLVKGISNDFIPNKDYFHMILRDADPGSQPVKLGITGLKALFFVKKYDGNPRYNEKKEFDPTRLLTGRKVKALFKDGELMVGTTNGYQPTRSGFFLVPADANSNNNLCFIFISATQEVSFI
jgi:hypothetical protein